MAEVLEKSQKTNINSLNISNGWVLSYLDFSRNFKQKIIDVLLLVTLATLMVACVTILKWNSFFLIVLLLTNIIIYISYRYEFSVPGISKLGSRYIKSTTQNFSQLNSSYFHFRFLYYLILLAYDIDSGFNLLLNNTNSLEITARSDSKISIKEQAVKDAYIEEGMNMHRDKKRKATIASLASSIILTVVILVIALLLGNNTKAGDLGWLQTDWSGGVTSTTISTSTMSGWNNYYSSESTISAGSDRISLISATSILKLTNDTDFSSNNSVNAYVADGSISILKPAQASCSANIECSSNSCVSGKCFLCGTDLVAYEGGPYDIYGKNKLSGGYYRTVLIGDKCWLKDNLNVGIMVGSKLADNKTPQHQSNNGIIEKYCYNYTQQGNNQESIIGAADCHNYGGLYQWPEALQYVGDVSNFSGSDLPTGNIKGICPSGWHLPSGEEFLELSAISGGDKIAGGKLREAGLKHWFSGEDSATVGTDDFGFSGFASGYRYSSGDFFGRYSFSGLWSTMLDGTKFTSARYRELTATNSFNISNTYRADGLSVRCVLDSTGSRVNSVATSTSAVKDLGGRAISLSIDWNASSTIGITDTRMEIRTGNSIMPDAESDNNWTDWTTIRSGEILNPKLLGNRYFQYRVILSSIDTASSPSLNDVTLTWLTYPTFGMLISSPYDSGSADTIMSKVSWESSNQSKSAGVKLQIRSADSIDNLYLASWCGYNELEASCLGTNFFDEENNGMGLPNRNHPLSNGKENRFFQYRILLSSDGSETPVVRAVNISW